MIGPDSRYNQADHVGSKTHTYDEFGVVDNDEDNGAPLTIRETLYLLTVPPIPVHPNTEYQAKETDNIQLLAYVHLNDPTRWWVIAEANPHIRYPLDMKMGDVVWMPT